MLAGFGLSCIMRLLWSFQYRMRNHSSFSMILFSSAAFPLRYRCSVASASAISALPMACALLSRSASSTVRLRAGVIWPPSGGRISASRVCPPGRAPILWASIPTAASAAGFVPPACTGRRTACAACAPPGPAWRCAGSLSRRSFWRSSSGLCLGMALPPYSQVTLKYSKPVKTWSCPSSGPCPAGRPARAAAPPASWAA